MDPTNALVRLVDAALQGYLDERAGDVHELSGEADELVDAARALLARGKRLRPQFLYWGWRAVAGADDDASSSQRDQELSDLVLIAQGIELFHAAALVHDDVIDRSDTRRGAPSAHRRFEQIHRSSRWTGDSIHFGESAAILLGDLLLSWAEERFGTALAAPLSDVKRDLVRRRIDTMKAQVTVGQYLDLLAQSSWDTRGQDDALDDALTVIRYKSAKYSVEYPLLIGAGLAGGTVGQAEALSRYGLALGEAFQLRDDVLGVFGDPGRTGKPAGDDLREGKRTYLLLAARRALPRGPRAIVDETIGDESASPDQIDAIARMVRETGALARVEKMIDEDAGRARAALDEGGFPQDAHRALLDLIDQAAYRTS